MDIDKIYREYFETVYKYLLYLSHNEELSEELTQETFYKAVMNINKFREECKISTWLISIAKNLYFDELKRSKKNVNINEIGQKIYNECIEDIVVSKDEKEELKNRINVLYVDKETGLTLRSQSGVYTSEANSYTDHFSDFKCEFGTVTEEDVTPPDFEEYTICK